jgi:hypothetical protein
MLGSSIVATQQWTTCVNCSHYRRDISATFNTINLEHPRSDLGADGVALDWLRSYFLDRQQFVKRGSHCSATNRCSSGVSQGSVLRTLIFAVPVLLMGDLISSHDIEHHQYEETQFFFLLTSASSVHTYLHRL